MLKLFSPRVYERRFLGHVTFAVATVYASCSVLDYTLRRGVADDADLARRTLLQQEIFAESKSAPELFLDQYWT